MLRGSTCLLFSLHKHIHVILFWMYLSVKASYVSYCRPVFVRKKDSTFMCFSLVRKCFCAQFITNKSWISFPFDCDINYFKYEDDDGFEPLQISTNPSWPVVFTFLDPAEVQSFLPVSLSWWVWLFLRTARSGYRSSDAPVTAASLDSGLSGSAYSLLDEDGEMNEVDSAIFQVPRL